jgi:hypothetical protein
MRNVDSHAKAFSKGKGDSVAHAGPYGSKASGVGTEGSGSHTNYNTDEWAVRDKFSTYKDSKGRVRKVRDNWSNRQRNRNHATGLSVGKGSTQSGSNGHKSGASAKGSKFAGTESGFHQHFHNTRDNWDMTKVGGKWNKKRNRFTNDSHTMTKGKSAGFGNAKANAESNHNGSGVDAHGEHASMGKTKHKNKNFAIADNRDWGFDGKAKWNRGHKWAKGGHSHGGTDALAMGYGKVNSNTHKDKGSKSSGWGSKGTKNNAHWGGHNHSVSNNWASDNFW